MSPTGLTAAEAAARLLRDGPNALPAAPATTNAQRLLRQFREPLVCLLLAAIALDATAWAIERETAWPVEAVAIAAILVGNAVLGLVQERRSERALERLADASAPWSWVLRDGALVRVPARDLVAGDVARLDEGDRIPADARVLPGTGFLVDESILTGESVPVARADGEELSAGTLVVRGAGFVEILRTGRSSALGKLAGLLGTIEVAPTPLETRMRAFGRRVAWGVAALALLLVALGVMLEGPSHLVPTVLFAVALAVAAVPEGLSAVMTFSLAVGVERMAARRAVVRRLSAVESLGRVTVIATDKTGTLTENRLVVRTVDTTDRAALARAAVLANDADLATGAGDPLDAALLAWARKEGADPEAIRAASPRTGGRPFDASVRSMSADVTEDGRTVTYMKGAPEAVLPECSLTLPERAAWAARAESAARDGYRVLVFARGPAGEAPVPAGLAMLWDTPRPEAAGAVQRARAAGIRVVMVTGDHPATAAAVARTVGIEAARTTTGAEFEAAGEATRERIVAGCSVFARFTPEQKLRLVECLKRRGDIVAMTGDGVNDAPALKRSDVGVSMGLRGSDVAREVSDLVLLDDHFATIVAAVEEGRRMFANIRTFVRFLVATNAAELAVVAAGFPLAWAMGLREADGTLLLPLTASQILWINLVTDGLPALALAFDTRRGAMDRPPEPADAPLFDRRDLRLLGVCAAIVATAGLGLLEFARTHGVPPESARTALFLFLAGAQLALIGPVRRLSGHPEPNRRLLAALAASWVLLGAAVVVPGLRAMLGLGVPETWSVVAAAAAIALPVGAAWAIVGRGPPPRASAAPRP